MSLAIPNFYIDYRPPMQRSRSHTDPSNPGASPHDPEANVKDNALPSNPKPARPTHSRSKSYLAPSTSNASTSNSSRRPPSTHHSTLDRAAEKLPLPIPRLHLHSHRYTQSHHDRSGASNAHRRHRAAASASHILPSDANPSSLPNLFAGLSAERARNHATRPPMPPSANSAYFGPVESRPADFAAGGRYRSSSNPPPLRPKSSFEEALERGDAARVARRIYVRKADIERLDREVREAEDEMRERLTEVGSRAVDLTRRLDYGYYHLLEKVGNLISTIQTFQSLSRQSAQLISNFDKEVNRLDGDTRKRVAHFKNAFSARESRANGLRERAQAVSAMAEDLSRRLENAQNIVQSWERREAQSRKRWDRVFSGIFWTTTAFIVLLISIVLAREWWFRGDPVKAGLRVPAEGNWNYSLRLGGEGDSWAGRNEKMMLEKESIPADVKELLQAVADKNRKRKVVFPALPPEICDGCEEAEQCLGLCKMQDHGDEAWSKGLDEL